MIEGAGLELAQVKESLDANLEQKEREVMHLSQAQAPHPANVNFEEILSQIHQGVQGLSQRLNPLRQGNHITHFLTHPKLINVTNVASNSSTNQCLVCYKFFDGWSGYYVISCSHYYHLVCLIRQIQSSSTCII